METPGHCGFSVAVAVFPANGHQVIKSMRMPTSYVSWRPYLLHAGIYVTASLSANRAVEIKGRKRRNIYRHRCFFLVTVKGNHVDLVRCANIEMSTHLVSILLSFSSLLVRFPDISGEHWRTNGSIDWFSVFFSVTIIVVFQWPMNRYRKACKAVFVNLRVLCHAWSVCSFCGSVTVFLTEVDYGGRDQRIICGKGFKETWT